jgi:hypothetical protein
MCLSCEEAVNNNIYMQQLCTASCVTSIQIFRGMMSLGECVSTFRRTVLSSSSGTSNPPVMKCLILKMQALHYSKMSSSTLPPTQHHIPEDVCLQRRERDNLTSFKFVILLCSNCIKIHDKIIYICMYVFKYIIKPQSLHAQPV